MRSTEDTFCRLTIGDPGLMAAIADPVGRPAVAPSLDGRTEAMVRIAALIALDAPASSYRAAVQDAQRSGATLDDLLTVLLALAGTVGSARIVSAAPKVAIAAGYDVEEAIDHG